MLATKRLPAKKTMSHVQYVTGILIISAKQKIVEHHFLLLSSSMKLVPVESIEAIIFIASMQYM